MSIRGKYPFRDGGLVGIVALLVSITFSSITAMGEETEPKPTWVWTKETPKPTWYKWDKSYWSTEPVRGGYFRRGVVVYVGLMNPHHWPVNDWFAISYIYDRLIITDGHYRPVTPWLAEAWEYESPLTITMKLRKGVTFHDGSPLNAESLKYQIEWIKDKKNGAWTRTWLEPIKSIEIMDDFTVKWHFSKPWAGFPGMFASVPGYMLSAKALKADVALREAKNLDRQLKRAKKRAAQLEKKAKKDSQEGRIKVEKAMKKVAEIENRLKEVKANAKGAKEFDTNPVGAGPFMLEEARPGNFLKLKRNPNWWFGKSINRPDMPYFDGLVFQVIPDPSVQLANMRAGKIDQLFLNKSQNVTVKDDPSIQSFVYPENHVVAFRFNLAKGPCRDIRVRKAISHAIDRKALIAGTEFGLGRMASCMYPDDHWAHNPDLKPVQYNPELSKKLLAQAGYSKGLTVKGYMGFDATSQSRAEAIKNMLANVGINWEVEVADMASGTDRMRNLEYDLASGGWSWIYDPDLMASGLYHPKGGFNYGRSNNEKAIALIESGRKEVDLSKRQRIYFELEKVLYDNYEDAWLFWETAIRSHRKNILGFNLDMFLENREAYFWSHPMWFKEGHP